LVQRIAHSTAMLVCFPARWIGRKELGHYYPLINPPEYRLGFASFSASRASFSNKYLLEAGEGSRVSVTDDN
jgi:hypothetical protein